MKYLSRIAGLACFMTATTLCAAGLATTRPASDAESRDIREALMSQYANGDTAKLSNVQVGKDKNQPTSKIQHVCGYANTTRFYGTLAKDSAGKPHVMILGTRDVADQMCAEKLGI